MDKLSATRIFITVARLGSFTQAAEELNLSRSMVTRSVELVETWLNVRLLNRTTRSVTLTLTGQEYLASLEQWVHLAQEMESMQDAPDQLRGQIQISSSVSFGAAQLAAAIQAFMQQHPQVKVNVILDDNIKDLTENQIDLAIRITSTPNGSLIGKPIATCNSMLVASPHYLAQHKPITHPNQLTQHACLGYRYFERQKWNLTHASQTIVTEVCCQLTANEVTFLVEACINGAGIALLPNYITEKYINESKLAVVLPKWQPAQMQVYALYSSRKQLPNITRRLIDHLQAYFALHPWA